MTPAGRRVLAGMLSVVPLVAACADRSSERAPVTTLVAVTGAPTSLADGDRGDHDVGDDVGDGVGAGVAEGFTTASLSTSTPSSTRFDGCVLVADTPDERAIGLMGRTDLGRFAGMVFVYDADTSTEFWMYDTPMPLSIAFIDGSGQVVSTADMEPCTSSDSDDCERYGASQPYRLAVEVPAGQLGSLGLVDGAIVEMAGPC